MNSYIKTSEIFEIDQISWIVEIFKTARSDRGLGCARRHIGKVFNRVFILLSMETQKRKTNWAFLEGSFGFDPFFQAWMLPKKWCLYW